MRFRLRPWLLAAALCGTGVDCLAESVVAEGVAAIRNGDIASAREEAVRNALANASRQASVQVSSTLGANGHSAFDETIIKSSARVHRHQVLGESRSGDLYTVSISAELDATAGRGGNGPCREGHTKRLLIGGFPLLRADQLQHDELGGYAYLTAGEIARRFGERPAVLVDQAGSLMTHFGVPERVVGDLPTDLQDLTIVREMAEKHRSQYVLVGRFHSLALSRDKSQRSIDLEALLLDPFTGTCIARKRFTKTATGEVVVPPSVRFGSPAHYATDFGRAYGEVLSEVARWAEATTSCQPFSSRVIKVENKAVYFDAGAEQGIGVGDVFSAFKSSRVPVTARGGELLGVEKKPAGSLRVTTVYPKFSIGEAESGPSSPRAIALDAGDALYSR